MSSNAVKKSEVLTGEGVRDGGLVEALIAAREAFQPVKKDKENPYYKSKYADLESVCNATDAALRDNGLVVMQYMDSSGDVPAERKYAVVEVTGKEGNIERYVDVIEARGPACFLVTELVHISGEKRTSRYPISPGLDPQQLGSAITYARRYALMAMLGIAAEDDDGNTATRRTVAPVKAITEDQADTIRDLIADVGANEKGFLEWMGVSSVSKIAAADYSRAVNALEKKRDER